jgi:OOP family OmpA-OmpF porin
MKITTLVVIVMGCLVSAWSLTEVHAFRIVTREMVQKETVTVNDLVRTVDNFIVLFDTSGSTNQMVPGRDITKIQAAKNMLKERAGWFPELGHQAGLYIYTGHETLAGTFKEVYGMQSYNRERFAAAVDKLPETGQGAATLNAGLSPLRKVLAGLSGKTAVIMFTDGKMTRMRGAKRPLQIAQEMARDHDVCFYMISSATADVEAQLVEAVDSINVCSRVIPLRVFLDNPNYLSGALFAIRTRSYVRLKPVTEVVGFQARDMLFDFDSSIIRSEYNEKLDLLGNYLQRNPDAYAVAGGYTDNTGDEEYNLWLSERRAMRVKNYLVANHGIDANRIVTLWFGPFNPVGDNATDAGRQLNRRVEIAVGTGR